MSDRLIAERPAELWVVWTAYPWSALKGDGVSTIRSDTGWGVLLVFETEAEAREWAADVGATYGKVERAEGLAATEGKDV